MRLPYPDIFLNVPDSDRFKSYSSFGNFYAGDVTRQVKMWDKDNLYLGISLASKVFLDIEQNVLCMYSFTNDAWRYTHVGFLDKETNIWNIFLREDIGVSLERVFYKSAIAFIKYKETLPKNIIIPYYDELEQIIHKLENQLMEVK